MTALGTTTRILLAVTLVLVLGLGVAIGYAVAEDGHGRMPMRMLPGDMGSMDMGSMHAHMRQMGMMGDPGAGPAPSMSPMHGHD